MRERGCTAQYIIVQYLFYNHNLFSGLTDINTIIIAVHITNIKQLLILIIIINYFESASSDGFDTFHL